MMSSDASRPPVRRNRRAVIVDGRYLDSVTDAAAEYNLGVPNAWTKARLGRGGWQFADEPPLKPVAPSATLEG
jgi:hypothetical protein